jgi:polyphosphate kinase 1
MKNDTTEKMCDVMDKRLQDEMELDVDKTVDSILDQLDTSKVIGSLSQQVIENDNVTKLKLIDGTWMGFNEAVVEQIILRENINDKLKFIGIVWDNVSEIYQLKYADNNMRYKKCKEAYTHYFRSCIELDNLNIVLDLEPLKSCAEGSKEYETATTIRKIFRSQIQPLIYIKSIDEEGFSPANKQAYVVFRRSGKKGIQNYQIEIPSNIPRVYKIGKKIVFAEQIVQFCLHNMIDNVKDICYVSVCRNSVFMYNGLSSLNLKNIVKENIDTLAEQWITAVTYTNKVFGESLKQWLSSEIKDNTTIKLTEYVSLGVLKDLDFSIGDKPKKNKSNYDYPEDIFKSLKAAPMLLYHPYDSFKSVEDFICDGAKDPKVLSIKMTLYRIPKKSKIISHLLEAKSNGKSVTIFIELKASSSEKDNLEIATLLKAAGVDIIFGNKNTKTHTKICVITRREGESLNHYAHIGTGNYSSSNAKSYTDYSYFVAGRVAGEVNEYFKYIATSNIKLAKANNVIATPKIAKKIISLIDAEIEKGIEGYIGIKCNGIDEKQIVKKLNKAIEAGVKVEIIARSANPIKKNQFEIPNLTMKSVVGDLLEHSRLYIFGSNHRTVIIGSADLMKRNLNTRKELLVIVSDIKSKLRLIGDFEKYMRDTKNSYYIYNGKPNKEGKLPIIASTLPEYDVQAALWD